MTRPSQNNKVVMIYLNRLLLIALLLAVLFVEAKKKEEEEARRNSFDGLDDVWDWGKYDEYNVNRSTASSSVLPKTSTKTSTRVTPSADLVSDGTQPIITSRVVTIYPTIAKPNLQNSDSPSFVPLTLIPIVAALAFIFA